MAKGKEKDKHFKVIISESQDEFERLVSEAMIDGWELEQFSVWSLASGGKAWYWFQTMSK